MISPLGSAGYGPWGRGSVGFNVTFYGVWLLPSLPRYCSHLGSGCFVSPHLCCPCQGAANLGLVGGLPLHGGASILHTLACPCWVKRATDLIWTCLLVSLLVSGRGIISLSLAFLIVSGEGPWILPFQAWILASICPKTFKTHINP